MFEWKQEYSVGIGIIDGQHQNLFAMARDLYAAMSTGQGKLAVGRILDRLVHYTGVHFAYEERLMQQHSYPNLAQHKAEHDALTKKVLALQADHAAGKVAMTIQLLQFLKDWLEHHIKESDHAYSPYLKAKAVV
ncbi:MAG TPA: bacteriohemerythrin [Verrucomicrobiae bacterium]|nr:bacteriohemerythrin [Verrucomicrobiae bacterium]